MINPLHFNLSGSSRAIALHLKCKCHKFTVLIETHFIHGMAAGADPRADSTGPPEGTTHVVKIAISFV
ncbi:hypothetical protein BABINDRAFT_159320 [Babjeviella inositovora NRRL Y-12698]|uniref:Uncharacterized protein n=1 Tax=Babjeviella inositovora NRRL Y-12698 TaxID=984486 RepID=A0A1E3QYW1_9ASCO|nr:uncharacterized protein BABINDRAFT_159320 [Babjeviella inositovora NRRL Y-12698]ODQ82818.1 hypothetical protein BABINDRAFT_159320 [Babjeviella inositovora NRRL Y-12698]